MYSLMITRRMMSREREAPRMRTGKSREIIARDSRRTRPVFGQSHICSSPRLSIMISVRSSEEKEICPWLASNQSHICFWLSFMIRSDFWWPPSSQSHVCLLPSAGFLLWEDKEEEPSRTLVTRRADAGRL